MFRRFILALALLLPAPFVQAAPIGIDGFDPLITLGFNPQPEPPPDYMFTTSQVVNPFDVMSQVSGIQPQRYSIGPFSGVDPQPFLLTLAVSEGTLVPPEPVVPVNNMFDVELRTGGEVLTLAFELFFPDGTPLRTVVNAQERGSLILSLNLIDANDGTQPDAVALRLKVLRNGDPLGLSEAPLPPAALLLGAALFGLGVFGRRRACSSG